MLWNILCVQLLWLLWIVVVFVICLQHSVLSFGKHGLHFPGYLLLDCLTRSLNSILLPLKTSFKLWFLRNFNIGSCWNVVNKIVRSCRPEVLHNKDVLKNFANFTGKHPCHSLFLMRLQAYSFYSFLRATFLKNTSEWLLLFGLLFNRCCCFWNVFFMSGSKWIK